MLNEHINNNLPDDVPAKIHGWRPRLHVTRAQKPSPHEDEAAITAKNWERLIIIALFKDVFFRQI